MSMNKKKLIRLALIDSKESRIDFLNKTIQNDNNCSLDDYFDKKFKKIIDEWKNNLKNLTMILVKSNKIEHLMYLIYKYPDTQKYTSYYTGYYNNIELYESGVALYDSDIISGAIKKGNLNMIKTVLEKIRNSYGTNMYNDFLITAIKCNENEIFKCILEHLNTLTYKFIEERTIKNCILYDKLELLKLIFQKYPDSANYICNYHLKYAIMQNNYNMIKFLLEKLPSNIKRERMFNYALRSKNLDIIKLFIYDGITCVNFDICENFAAENNCLEILKWCYTSLKYCDKCKHYFYNDSLSVSIVAAKNGHIDIIKFLFENKYIKSEELCDIAFIAAGKGYPDIVKYAVDNGADNFISVVRNAKDNGFEEIANTYSKYID